MLMAAGRSGPSALYEYDLFAVINHEGQMDNGHYTNFARFQDEVILFISIYVLTDLIIFLFSGIGLMTISESKSYC
jgi:hypothetical protein